jgi:hypothetical protein
MGAGKGQSRRAQTKASAEQAPPTIYEKVRARIKTQNPGSGGAYTAGLFTALEGIEEGGEEFNDEDDSYSEDELLLDVVADAASSAGMSWAWCVYKHPSFKKEYRAIFGKDARESWKDSPVFLDALEEMRQDLLEELVAPPSGELFDKIVKKAEECFCEGFQEGLDNFTPHNWDRNWK